MFVITHRHLAAQHVLADRDGFRLDPEALDTWERHNGDPPEAWASLHHNHFGCRVV